MDALITLSRVPRRPPRADVLLTALLFVWAALEAVIATMAERVGCAEIVTSCVPENAVAAGLYASLGFRPTGEVEDGEPLVRLRLADRRSPRDQ